MSEDEFSRIEQTLAIRLPDVYRHRLSSFPIPQNAGNSDTQVWDDAEKLLALNQRLRTEVEGWTPWLFVIGQAEGDSCGYAIDTRNPECPVWWLEQMRLGLNSGPTQGPFVDWFSQSITELSPGETSEKSCRWMLVAWVALSVLALVSCWAWATYLHQHTR
jgi:hypothetical protein